MIEIIARYGTIFFLLINLAGCSQAKILDRSTPSAYKETLALEYWRSNTLYKPITWIESDLDSDSRMDTVLIYREAEDKCMMCAILNTTQGFVIIPSTRAPMENQIIQSKDIDNRPPMEIMVSGSKNGKVGYAIFRLENNQLIDLFAEGMNECC